MVVARRPYWNVTLLAYVQPVYTPYAPMSVHYRIGRSHVAVAVSDASAVAPTTRRGSPVVQLSMVTE